MAFTEAQIQSMAQELAAEIGVDPSDPAIRDMAIFELEEREAENPVVGNVGTAGASASFFAGQSPDAAMANIAEFDPFREEDVESVRALSPTARLNLIQAMQAAGLPVGDIGINLWSPTFENTYAAVLQFANDRYISSPLAAIAEAGQFMRETQQDLLSLAGGGGRGGGGGGGAPAPTFAPPDPATLRARVTETLKRDLGRDPQPQELQALANELGTLSRQQFDAAVAGGQQVDPMARFDELVQERYGEEIGMLDERQETFQTEQATTEKMSFIDRLAQGAA